MSVLRIDELRSADVDAIGDVAESIGVVPLGSTEQHGPHLPVGTDTFILARIIDAVGESVEDILVLAPALPIGYSSYHTSFAGSFSFDEGVCEGLIGEYIDGLARSGFRRIAVISHHGGNFAPLVAACRMSEQRWPSCKIAGYSDLSRYLAIELEAARASGILASDSDAHAGAVETSLMMYLTGRPAPSEVADLVGFTGPTKDGWVERLMELGIESLSQNGVLGEPRLGTAEGGKAIFDALVEEVATWLSETLAVRVRQETSVPS